MRNPGYQAMQNEHIYFCQFFAAVLIGSCDSVYASDTLFP